MSANNSSTSSTAIALDGAQVPLAELLWPAGSVGAAVLRGLVLVAMGTALLTLSAKVNVPMYPVPMTMQTLVVLLLPVLYGWRLGTATIIAYLAEGAFGLPVFATGAGLAYMAGPTGGFLAGFVVATVIVGLMVARFDRSLTRLFAMMILGHIVILSMGFVWLAFGLSLGEVKAWMLGVHPFLAGSVVKSALGAALVLAVHRSVKTSA
jgi:biotin transport system substrate-specific component